MLPAETNSSRSIESRRLSPNCSGGKQTRRTKIVLYHPATCHEKFYSYSWIPYSLLAIASTVSDRFEVVILDDNIHGGEHDFATLATDCLCVGISSMTGHQITGGLSFAAGMKEIDPSIPIIWGGAHPTILPDLTIAHPLVDVVIKGQGEYAFSEVVKRLEKQIVAFDGIPGVVFKRDRQIVTNGPPVLRDKSGLPLFPWHLLDLNAYVRNDDKIGSRILNYVSSQGCPFECTFCSEVAIYAQKWKSYGLERILGDIKYLVEAGGANAIKFYDANFFVNISTVMRFAAELARSGQDVSWAAAGHPRTLNSLSDDQWASLRDSKCARLLIGAESGSEDALNIVQKHITPASILTLAEKCSAHRIVGSFTFIVGFPNCPDAREYEKTLELAANIRGIDSNHDVKVHFYAPYPGTPLFDEACKAGFKSPRTLEEWAEYDYYTVETPWVDPLWEPIVHRFNSENSPYVHL